MTMMKNRLFLTTCLIAVILQTVLFTSCKTETYSDPLRNSFVNPPDSARPGVYWYFMDGNLDSAAMTADLESMKKAGIGYVLFLEVNVGVPRGKIDFLSERWQDLFTHAVRDAERLGIKIILGSGPGWAGSGGPWVTPAQSMLHLVASDTTVKGPGKFNGIIRVPDPRKPFFGEGSLTKSLKEQRDNWFENISVLAFPAPNPDARIDLIDEKALYYRAPYTSQAGVLPNLPEPTSFNEKAGSSIDVSKIIDLTSQIDSIGRLNWVVPPGKWTIMRFVTRNNGAVTRPAPLPGLGFEADKFDTASFDAHYNSYVGKLIKKVKPLKVKSGGGWTMIHIDSWEMGSQNWSPRFREEFTKRRGYDPAPYLPVYTGRIVGSREISERFLWDLRMTSNELIMENHAGRFKELGQRNGFRLSIEPYDMNPASDFDLGSVADVPMCEFWSDGFGYNSAFSCIEATSIAHVKGVPVVAAESFTADSPEAWKKYPGDMKNQGDWAFSMGINRFVYHTFAHKPFSDKLRPGVTMGPYGVHWDRGQTWWSMSSAYHLYVSRCQYLLSQGKGVSDILYLTPEGAPQVFQPPVSALEGTAVIPDKKGYSFDCCSPLYLIRNASVNDGLITFPGGATYKVLVLPDADTMTPELIAKLKELVNEGATIVGNPPERSPSLSGYPGSDEKVIKLADEVWGNSSIPIPPEVRIYGKGKVVTGKGMYKISLNGTVDLYPEYSFVTDILHKSGLKPDFESAGNIRYTHRSLSDREIYFISNRTDSVVNDNCNFRDGSNSAEIWDAVTGEMFKNIPISEKEGITSVSVKLNPYQSLFIVFNKNDRTDADMVSDKNPFTNLQKIKVLEGKWNLSFDTAMGGPESIVFDSLYDWSISKEEGIRYYSGIAKYSKEFNFDKYKSDDNSELYLNLGKVKNLARVRLNGKDLGIIWTSPWHVNVTKAIKKGNNKLEIEVANLWPNRLIGDEEKPWDGGTDGKWPEWLLNGTPRTSGRYTFTTHHYYRKGDPLLESGLLGPVSIMQTTN